MKDQREDNSNPKRPPSKQLPKSIITHNVPTDDVENTNGTK